MYSTYQVVTVYTQPGCLPCKRVVSKLQDAGVPVDVVDITEDPVSKDYVTQVLKANSVPVVEAPGFEVIRGYQPDKLKDLIREWTLPIDEIHDYVYQEGEQ